MEFLLDSVNLDEIKAAVEHFPLAGVTSNPSIVKKTHPADFWKHMEQVRALIGDKRSLHVQVIATDKEGMIKDAEAIVAHLGKETYIKVPVSYEGLAAIVELKNRGFNVTATAIYDPMQAFLAYSAGADYMAPYYNRIGNNGGDPDELIRSVSGRIRMEHSDCKLLAASFKSAGQVRNAIESGTQAVTVSFDVLTQVFKNANISKAVNDFNADWRSMYGDKTLAD